MTSTTEIQKAANRERMRRLRKCKDYKAKEAAHQSNKRQKPEGWAKATIPNIRSRAKTRGIEFNLTYEDIIPPARCPVFGTKINLKGPGRKITRGRAFNSSPSVDRIDNSKGYVKGNIKVISFKANALKSDATLKELEQIVAYIKREESFDHNSI